MNENEINKEMEDLKDQPSEERSEQTAEHAGTTLEPEGGKCAGKEDRRSRKAQKKAAELEEKLAELEEKVAKEKDDYLRLMAEFDNFRRRTAQDRLELISSASKDVISGLLPVLDDFERALKVLGESSDSEAAKEGTGLIYNKLMDYLKGKGLAVIDAVGKEFDTDLHEAVAQFPVEDPKMKGKVFDIAQTGYTLNGKVIRFAKVVVAI